MISRIREKAIIKEWDKYWIEDAKSKRHLYNSIARFYRKVIIRHSLNYFALKYFKRDSDLLHAGCGGGEVDHDIQKDFSITGIDISPCALKLYRKNAPESRILGASIFKLPLKSQSVDGIYNLGVMEHYSKDEIKDILLEFYRVLKKDGKILLFWPPEYGLSVIFFKILVFFTKDILGVKNIKFHPDEISRIKSKKDAKEILQKAGFRITDFYFGLRDLFTYCAILATKN